jgi:hypothetical protein
MSNSRKAIKLITIVVLLLTSIVNAQTTFKYYNPKHFKGHSIVFTKEYKANFSLREFNGQFTPTKEEIDSAEALFMKRYDTDINKKEDFKVTHNPRRYYKNYKRQYMGIMSNNGEKLIFIQMLNVPKPRRKNLEYYYENWENVYVVGTGNFYELNTVRFIVNLTKGEMKLY